MLRFHHQQIPLQRLSRTRFQVMHQRIDRIPSKSHFGMKGSSGYVDTLFFSITESFIRYVELIP